ncbi:hypothetical protein FPZ54_05200 [Sphingomonas suaedae]|uniref:Uncharacterized protein n=1 Tax=Sphingomonas suaedae TaxID=2599297 RepID=A0A518RDC7_9SPHN|nr:hypothetical protein [Sphingomonas suaedae]QDX25477.1 hypothetical protein FPZ54_05200 [Sphingomonas suaedae]
MSGSIVVRAVAYAAYLLIGLSCINWIVGKPVATIQQMAVLFPIFVILFWAALMLDQRRIARRASQAEVGSPR